MRSLLTSILRKNTTAVLMDVCIKACHNCFNRGGVDIEEVAEVFTRKKILKVLVDPALGLRPYQARQSCWITITPAVLQAMHRLVAS